mmetsp:Transcript_48253/g.104506  ORF Transcript_48253/g.104506 Transcript_48253/m.104506 type:complete len:416 (-) Transcript_48253:1263-2510(-)
MLVARSKERGRRLWKVHFGHALQHLEEARAERDRDAQNDALRHPRNRVHARVHRRLEQVVGGLLKGREHEDALFHLGHAEASDAEHLPSEGHDVGEQRHMARVDVHPVVAHRVLDLVHDRLPCRLDAERLLNLHDVSRPRERTANTRSAHHRKQPRAFDQQLVARPPVCLLRRRFLALFFLRDDRACHLLDATDKHALERLFEAVEVEERKLLAAAVSAEDADLVLRCDLHVGLSELQLRSGQDGVANRVRGDRELQPLDQEQVDADADVAVVLVVNLLDHRADLSEIGALDKTFDGARVDDVEGRIELRLDDRRRDRLRGVDNLLNPRHSERDIHRCHPGEVEGLQSHLGPRLADRLSAHGADSRPRLDLRSLILLQALFQKSSEQRGGEPVRDPFLVFRSDGLGDWFDAVRVA